MTSKHRKTLSVNAHVNIVAKECNQIRKYSFGGFTLQHITYLTMINELNEYNNTTQALNLPTKPLMKYHYNKFFKVYSRVPNHLLPVLPSDVETTDFIHSVIKSDESAIIKVMNEKQLDTTDNNTLVTIDDNQLPATIAYLVRSANYKKSDNLSNIDIIKAEDHESNSMNEPTEHDLDCHTNHSMGDDDDEVDDDPVMSNQLQKLLQTTQENSNVFNNIEYPPDNNDFEHENDSESSSNNSSENSSINHSVSVENGGGGTLTSQDTGYYYSNHQIAATTSSSIPRPIATVDVISNISIDENSNRKDSNIFESSATVAVTMPNNGKTKRKRGNQTEDIEESRLLFSDVLDDRLREAVDRYGEKDWMSVASYVGHGVSNERCLHRWNYYIKPELQSRKTGPWSEEECALLRNLVGKYINNPNDCTAGRSKYKSSINWSIISKELNRHYMDCVGKWEKIRYSVMKQGFFTEEEDAIIKQRVYEWGDRGKGLWKMLEGELGRPGKNISQRWRKQLQIRDNNTGRNNRGVI